MLPLAGSVRAGCATYTACQLLLHGAVVGAEVDHPLAVDGGEVAVHGVGGTDPDEDTWALFGTGGVDPDVAHERADVLTGGRVA